MAVPTTVSGRVAKVVIGSVNITAHEWSVEEVSDELDGTTAEDDGYEVTDYGVTGLRITVRGWYTIGASKVAPLRAGQRGSSTFTLNTYKLGADTGQTWILTNYTCVRFEMTARVRDRIEFVGTVRSRGTYTGPVDPA